MAIQRDKMYQKYLPSKNFIKFLIILLIIGVLLTIVFYAFSWRTSFLNKKENKLETKNTTINDLLSKDSDGDGVYDWEEALWGTDPKKQSTFDDISDKTYIENKRKDLKIANVDNLNEGNSETETAKFARQFFASIAAMKQTGQIDEETIYNVSSSLGQGIVNPVLTDIYSEKDILVTKSDSTSDKEDYYIKAANLFEKSKTLGAGEELEIIGGMAGSGTATKASTDKLAVISSAYQDFAKKLTLIPVPNSLKSYHVKIANSSHNTGIAVTNMTKIIDDPIIGLSGVSEYQKYSQDLISSVESLEAFLSANGIISE